MYRQNSTCSSKRQPGYHTCVNFFLKNSDLLEVFQQQPIQTKFWESQQRYPASQVRSSGNCAHWWIVCARLREFLRVFWTHFGEEVAKPISFGQFTKATKVGRTVARATEESLFPTLQKLILEEKQLPTINIDQIRFYQADHKFGYFCTF